MIQEFRLPDLGEGLPEAELVQWLVSEGDRVALNQTIAEVETAKAVVELPSPHAGVVQALHAAAGDVVEVGSPLISFEVGAEASARPAAPAASSTATADPAPPAAPVSDAPADDAAGPNLVGYGAAPRSGNRPRRRPRIATSTPRTTATDTAVLAVAPHDDIRLVESVESVQERPRSTPPVRKLAKDLGVDIALVTGTGQDGLITRDDVRGYAETTARADQQPVRSVLEHDTAEVGETRIPIRGVRKHTADAMVRSAFTAPHVTVFLTVDVTETTELVASLREDRSLADHRIGVLAVAAKAVCLALRHHPTLNSRWDGESGEIVQYHGVHLGIAAATERGLVVPNIRDADRMTLPALADAIRDLATTARAGKTSPEAMRGGTFSITNVGVFGVDAGTPILNPGEAGILAIGAVRSQPWEHRGQIALRDVVTLALSFDHRLVDGEQGSRFLADVGAVLREPGRAMLLG
ncbi:pyruvate dehydrogenase E2 component (dihydrolipoamide acetyltransferase) [Microbacterium sp. SLBN-154]|uniref:dihydrolipoamide acetyltransferase family protein n=1 Tax=Microbacterium sp. SLBN-154 TaxID=2768458 RepID=UPI00115410D3|nr:dihydrolipoamide acetyltransferase family protein [Microbacterium sp. SLBN-154]TQK19451.1 pyruvate dehydrogenase E2 component (dihydrolipoamide acetyltransferase) [Microbacterium sp. SLBN-154]